MKRLPATLFHRKKIFIILSLLMLIIICLAVVIFVSYSNSINPSGIVIHHSAVPFNIEKPEDISIISEIHQKRGYSIFYWGNFYHIGYHYLVLPNGQVVQGRPERCRGAHAKGYNDRIGICLIGNFSEKDNPTKEQIESVKLLIKDLRNRHLINATDISTHHNLDDKTECPGNKFPTKEVLNDLE